MRERPSRDERRENRKLKQEAKLRGMSLEEFKNQRDTVRAELQKEQEDLLASNPNRLNLDKELQIEGRVRLDGSGMNNHRSLVSMLTKLYKKFDPNDSLALEKANKIYRKLKTQMGGELMSTPLTLIEIAGNQLSIVGVSVIREKLAAPKAKQAVMTDQKAPDWDRELNVDTSNTAGSAQAYSPADDYFSLKKEGYYVQDTPEKLGKGLTNAFSTEFFAYNSDLDPSAVSFGQRTESELQINVDLPHYNKARVFKVKRLEDGKFNWNGKNYPNLSNLVANMRESLNKVSKVNVKSEHLSKALDEINIERVTAPDGTKYYRIDHRPYPSNLPLIVVKSILVNHSSYSQLFREANLLPRDIDLEEI